MAAVLHVKVQRRPRLLLWPKRGRHVSNMLKKMNAARRKALHTLQEVARKKNFQNLILSKPWQGW